MLSSVHPSLVLKEIYQEAMVHSFRMMIYSSKAFMQFGDGHIVLLFGSSSAGKSSLCREFLNISPNWVCDGNDKSSKRLLKQVCQDITLFKDTFPSRYQFLSTHFDDHLISQALTQGNDVLFTGEDALAPNTIKQIQTMLDDVSLIEELCLSMENILIAQEDMFEQAMRRSKQGINVILDTLDFENFMRFRAKRNFSCPFQAVFVFCPLTILDQRVEDRNQKAFAMNNPDDYRLDLFPFLTYSSFVRRAKAGDQIIDSVPSGQLVHVLEKHKQQQVDIYQDTNISGDLKFVTDLIFQELEVDGTSDDVLNLTDRYPSDYILRTDEHTPLELAQTIKERNKKRL